MPKAFDTAKYAANFDPTKKGTFVSVQGAMHAQTDMWSKVWETVFDLMPTWEDMWDQLVTGLGQVINDIFPAAAVPTATPATPLQVWQGILTGLVGSWTSPDFVNALAQVVVDYESFVSGGGVTQTQLNTDWAAVQTATSALSTSSWWFSDFVVTQNSWTDWLTDDWNTLLSWFGISPSGVATTPPTVQQSWVTDLENDLAALLDTSTWTTWLTTEYNALLSVFGMSSSTSTPTVAQSWVTGLSTALTTFVTTGNYNPLLTALFGSTTVGSTVQVTALPTNIPQTYISGLTSALATFLTTGNWNTLLTALFGGTTVSSTIQTTALPTNIPQTYISGLSSALSTFLTTGNYNVLLNALFGSTTVGSTVAVAALPTNIPQSNISGLTSALTTFVTTGNYTPLLTALFGGNFVGSTLVSAAVPNITAGTGPGQSSDLLTHLNAVSAAAGTPGSTPLSAATAGMNLITNTLASVSAAMQQQSSQNTGATNSGQSYSIYFPTYDVWADVPVNTTYGNIPGQSSHGSGTFVINSSGDAAWNAVNNGDVSGIAIFNGAGGQAFTNTDYQKLTASLAGLPNGGNAKNYCVVRANAITNPGDYVYGVVYLNTSFQLIWEVGCLIGGTPHQWATGTDASLNLNFTFVAGVGTNPNRYQGYSGSTLVFDHTNVSGDPGGLFPVNSSHRYWGFRSDTASSGQTTPAPASYIGIADNTPPTIPGVGMRMYRTNTANATVPLNMDAVGTFNSQTFFDATSEPSNGVRQYTSFTGSARGDVQPIIQVDNAGRYMVSIRSDISTATCSSGAVSICAGVQRYNSAGALQETRLFGSPGFFTNGFGGQYNTGFFGGDGIIGCQAGDLLEAVYYLDSGPASTGALSAMTFNGEASGGHTYFEVALANWSFN